VEEKRDGRFLVLRMSVKTAGKGGENIPVVMGVGVGERTGGAKGKGVLQEAVNNEVTN